LGGRWRNRLRTQRGISMSSKFSIILSVLLCAIWGGCAAPPVPEEPEVCERQVLSAAVISTAHINPAESGEARPVQLRLYQLKNDVGFRNATFDDVWKADEEKLGDDLLDRQEFSVYPNARQSIDLERNPEAQFIVA